MSTKHIWLLLLLSLRTKPGVDFSSWILGSSSRCTRCIHFDVWTYLLPHCLCLFGAKCNKPPLDWVTCTPALLTSFNLFFLVYIYPFNLALLFSLDFFSHGWLPLVRQTHGVHEEHEDHESLMKCVQNAVDTLVSEDYGDNVERAKLLDRLRVNISKFGRDLLEHLDHEEHAFATPIARKVCVCPMSALFTSSNVLCCIPCDLCPMSYFLLLFNHGKKLSPST